VGLNIYGEKPDVYFKLKKYKNRVLGLFLLLCLFTSSAIFATDEEADVELKNAKTALATSKFRKAGDYFMAARLYADTPEIKCQALIDAASAYGKANQRYKQFECLRDLITGFPDKIDFEGTIKKEYKIGNIFARGHRDITLSWMPWIKGEDKSIEIFETILKQAPFAKFAAPLKLRLGLIYLKDDKFQQALKMFKKVMKEHPNTKEDKFARFELANALVQLSIKAGDGDGMYAREAEGILRKTLKKYPNDPETKWIKQSIYETDDIRAKRLCDIAKFYVSRKNPEAATRYFHELLARYPTSVYAKTANKELESLDTEFKPKPIPKSEKITYPMLELQEEPKVILIAPQASGGKWLLPIEDLDLDGVNAENEYQAKLSAKREAKEKAKRARAKRLAIAKRKKEIAAKKAKAEKAQKIKAEKERQEKIKVAKEKAEKVAQEKKLEIERIAKAKIAAQNATKKVTPKIKKAKKKPKVKKAPPVKNDKKGNIEKTSKAKKEISKDSNYLIPIIIAILLLIAGIALYLKKKKNSGA